MSGLRKLAVYWSNGTIESILYDPDTYKSVVVEKVGHDGEVAIRPDDSFNIQALLKTFGVPDDIKAALEAAMLTGETESARLRYCSNGNCEKPFNWNIASRCDACGNFLPTSDEVELLPSPIANINMGACPDWSNHRRALALVEEGKIKYYITRMNHSCSLAFGWDGLKPFNRKKHSFRGRSNRAMLQSFDNNIDIHGDLERKVNWVDERLLSEGFLRFVDKYGAQLMESTTVELNPEGADALRDEYIFRDWEYGTYTDPATGITSHPRLFFVRNFFNYTTRDSELLLEAAWDLYLWLVRKAETRAIVRKDGKVEWRFATIEENWDNDDVVDFLKVHYAADDFVIERVMKPADADEDDEDNA